MMYEEDMTPAEDIEVDIMAQRQKEMSERFDTVAQFSTAAEPGISDVSQNDNIIDVIWVERNKRRDSIEIASRLIQNDASELIRNAQDIAAYLEDGTVPGTS